MIPSTFPTKAEIARLTARMLLEIKAVHFNAREPFTLASGLPSPTYIDCRTPISHPRIRSTMMDFMATTVMRDAGFEAFDNIAYDCFCINYPGIYCKENNDGCTVPLYSRSYHVHAY